MAAEDAIVESGMGGVSDVSSLQSLTHPQSLIPDPRIADPRIPNPESRIPDLGSRINESSNPLTPKSQIRDSVIGDSRCADSGIRDAGSGIRG